MHLIALILIIGFCCVNRKFFELVIGFILLAVIIIILFTAYGALFL